ncbi:hypothetical protein L1987_74249 [Smallanthus sonchifolius]|uniref:Uncharacterized protein n=1 Tax=Smallanthus sonchifolius TaxID=185202 RepID=A0ACB9A3R1_9ASTR|nr:hypothetical protein L1987_74249 [Smallanthus sonchifolius]
MITTHVLFEPTVFQRNLGLHFGITGYALLLIRDACSSTDISVCFPTAIINSRSREKVYDFVKLDSVYNSKSHVMDTIGPALKNNSYDKNYQ